MGKRKADLSSNTSQSTPTRNVKKIRIQNNTVQSDSPKRRAFSRICKFQKGDKVIGFYGGWPYVGSVLATTNVRMSFGSTYLVQIRWNGFSGKNATSWLSEFDVMKHSETSLKMKSDMEEAQRELQRAAGKLDMVKQKRIFLQVISQFRGNRLAPFAPLTARYPDEWQVIIRIAALPKTLVDHLRGCEGLINERKLLIVYDEIGQTAGGVLSDWAGEDRERLAYKRTIGELFANHFMQLLVYRFEAPAVVKKITEACKSHREYIETFSAEFLLRLMNVLPQILTPASLRVFRKSAESDSLSSLIDFVNAHQAFLGHLEDNIEPLLRAPIRKATLDEPVPDDYWIDEFISSEVVRVIEAEEKNTCSGNAPPVAAKRTWTNKRKNPLPIYKAPIALSSSVAAEVSIETPSIY